MWIKKENVSKDVAFLSHNVLVHFSYIFFLSLMMLSAVACNKEEFTPTPIITDPAPKQYDVPFTMVPNTSDISMYEVNLIAFSAEGNLKGVQSRLDEIKKLGINVIWLMPIYEPGVLKSVGSPYAVKNYTKINSAFGNLEDLRLLVKEAHSRNMAVILDWVANHTAWDNAWIQNKTWYTTDAGGNIISPPGSGWPDVADLNYGSQEMRREMIKSMKYWVLEANVDGFRCDFAEGVPNDFWKQAIDALRAIPNRKIIMFAEASKPELFNPGFDLIFGWNFYNNLKDVFNGASTTTLISANATDNNNTPANKGILRWITNHDDNAWDDSPVNIFQGKEGALTAFVLTAYMGGVPLIYNGQEVGFSQKLPFFSTGTTKIDWTADPDFLAVYQKLMIFRGTSDAVKNGSIEPHNSADVMAFKRILGTEEVLVIANIRNSIKDYSLPASIANTTWTNALTNESLTFNTSVSLAPYGYLILKK